MKSAVGVCESLTDVNSQFQGPLQLKLVIPYQHNFVRSNGRSARDGMSSRKLSRRAASASAGMTSVGFVMVVRGYEIEMWLSLSSGCSIEIVFR